MRNFKMINYKSVIKFFIQKLAKLLYKIPITKNYIKKNGVVNSIHSNKSIKFKVIKLLYGEFLNFEYQPESYKSFQSELWDREATLEWNARDEYDFTPFESFIENCSSLVDLGCGNGHNLALINKKFPHIQTYGIDASANMIQLAQKKAPNTSFYCGFYGIDSDAFLPQVDIVIARSTLTYIDESDIINILYWIFNKAEKYVVISDPSGKYDVKDSVNTKILSEKSYLRLRGDQSHIRNYNLYIKELFVDDQYSLVKEFLDNSEGNYNWIYKRNI